MEKYTLEKDLKVFGFEVKNFPEAIGDAFDKLITIISGEFDRSYYGICGMSEKGLIYKAAAEEKYEGEAQKYHCNQYCIERGEYLTVTLKNWRKKTDSIKGIFHKMMQDERVDKMKPSVEWYKNDDEMLCMVKSKE